MSIFHSVLNGIDRMFPTPRYLNFNSVAIDISPKKIRLMKLRQTKDGLIPVFYKEVPLSKVYNLHEISAPKDIKNDDVKEIVDVLKSLKKEFDLQGVIVSLPEFKNYIFRTELPAEAASDVASAIRFDLEENVPLSIHDVNFDFSIINKDRNSAENIDVMVNVFPKTIIGVYTKILRMAELLPVGFQSESIAFANATIIEGDADPYMIIRILEDRVNIAIVEEGVVQYTSSINVDSNSVLENYESKYAVYIKEELNKLLVFWFTNQTNVHEHKKIQTAYIAGDFADAPGMQEFLERHLNIKIELSNVWVNCFNTSDFVPEMSREESLKYVIAIGMAITGVKNS